MGTALKLKKIFATLSELLTTDTSIYDLSRVSKVDFIRVEYLKNYSYQNSFSIEQRSLGILVSKSIKKVADIVRK